MGRKRLGLVLIGIGFGIAVLTGLGLAVGAADDLSTGALIAGALGAFIPVMGFVGVGIYFYTQDDDAIELPQNPADQMNIQRELFDLLKAKGCVPLDETAASLEVEIADIHDMLYQLVELQVFSGYVNWDENLLCYEAMSTLSETNRCRVCGNGVDLPAVGTMICSRCHTEYFTGEQTP